MGALPIPALANDVLFIYFTEVEAFNGLDYIMSIVDGLSRFAQFVPTKKSITGEGAFKLLFQNWISKFGAPREVYTDNDVRFTSTNGFWQVAMKRYGVDVRFSPPRHPQSNGLCERLQRSFKQVLRVLMAEQSGRDWPRVVPLATWVLNNQWYAGLDLSPAELFLGRPGWYPKVAAVESEESPLQRDWFNFQLEKFQVAQRKLQQVRAHAVKKRNKFRKPAVFAVDDYVLVHRRRFPQWHVEALGPQWFGPYRIVKVKAFSVKLRASPKLGGEIEVPHEFLKKWPHTILEDDEPFEFDEGSAEEEDGEEESARETQEMDLEEAEQAGYYHVERIVRHRFKQGWRFLVKWEGWPIADSTWEPVRAFIQNGSVLNSKFVEYCTEHHLQAALKQAFTLMEKFQERRLQ